MENQIMLSFCAPSMLARAAQLQKHLEDKGYTVFAHINVQPNRETLCSNAANCKVFVPLMNEEWCKDKEREFEFTSALHQNNYILPVFLEEMALYEQYLSIVDFTKSTAGIFTKESELGVEVWEKVCEAIRVHGIDPIGLPSSILSSSSSTLSSSSSSSSTICSSSLSGSQGSEEEPPPPPPPVLPITPTPTPIESTQVQKLLLEDVLQSITWGANTSGKATLAIKSAHFGTYLRMEGYGPYPPLGGGIVNCQLFVGIYELVQLVTQEYGSVAIRSVHCGNYLRMDGGNVTGNGGGVVNCQSSVGPMEKFIIQAVQDDEDGVVTIRSALFNTYLRMDGINSSTQPVERGGGNVDCSREIRSWERFKIEAIKPIVALQSVACKKFLRIACLSSTEITVCGQNYLAGWEKFILVRAEDGTIRIRSVAFKTHYLHIQDDTGNVTASVTLQSRFLLHVQPDGSTTFESIDYKNLFLSMAPNGVVSCTPSPISSSHCFSLVVTS